MHPDALRYISGPRASECISDVYWGTAVHQSALRNSSASECISASVHWRTAVHQSASVHWGRAVPPRYSVFRVDSSGANRARAAAYVLSARLDEQSPSFIFYCISHLVFVNVFEYVFVFEALIVGLYLVRVPNLYFGNLVVGEPDYQIPTQLIEGLKINQRVGTTIECLKGGASLDDFIFFCFRFVITKLHVLIWTF